MKKIIVMLLTLIYQNIDGMNTVLKKSCLKTDISPVTNAAASPKQVTFNPNLLNVYSYTTDNSVADHPDSDDSSSEEEINAHLCWHAREVETDSDSSDDETSDAEDATEDAAALFNFRKRMKEAIIKQCENTEYHALSTEKIKVVSQKILLNLNLQKDSLYQQLDPSARRQVALGVRTSIIQWLTECNKSKKSQEA